MVNKTGMVPIVKVRIDHQRLALWVISAKVYERCVCKLPQEFKEQKDYLQLGDPRRFHEGGSTAAGP